jgi:hypothetical protein
VVDPLFERDVAKGEEQVDGGLRGQLLADTTAIIADRLGREDTPESEMLTALDGVPFRLNNDRGDRYQIKLSCR